MVVELPFVTMQVPVLALFRLLRVNTRQEAMEAIVGDGEANEGRLLASILDNDSTADMSLEALYDYIGREGTRETTREKRERYIDHIINCEILPHQGLVSTPEVLRAKALYLGIMIRKLIRVYIGELQCDDRDHLARHSVGRRDAVDHWRARGLGRERLGEGAVLDEVVEELVARRAGRALVELAQQGAAPFLVVLHLPRDARERRRGLRGAIRDVERRVGRQRDRFQHRLDGLQDLEGAPARDGRGEAAAQPAIRLDGLRHRHCRPAGERVDLLRRQRAGGAHDYHPSFKGSRQASHERRSGIQGAGH